MTYKKLILIIQLTGADGSNLQSNSGLHNQLCLEAQQSGSVVLLPGKNIDRQKNFCRIK